MYFTPMSCTCNAVKVVNFRLCVFYHNKKIGEETGEWIRVHQARMRGRASRGEGTAYVGLTGMCHDGSFGELRRDEVSEGIRQRDSSNYVITGSPGRVGKKSPDF